jgi:hypothetical protein
MALAVTTRIPEDGSQRQDVQPVVIRHLRTIFDRMPDLAAFRVRSDFTVVDVTAVSSTPPRIQRLHVNVMRALVELAECDPEAISLMRGHVFARSSH